ncbi:alkaline phosphatase D family protein [Congregibacter brevis]|uniref:Alkaline phosphatase D family protein n=1 Tax=Congregibacter brevis TaxID=3081201 RepID=A0ABZ0IBV8_9GAMM|nr:alkaline phosphatase D family protein [Congregibacter sp. IMCC45268]
MRAQSICLLLLSFVFVCAPAFAQWPAMPNPPSIPVFKSLQLDVSATVTRLAFGSCYKAQLGGERVWQSIADTQPNLFIFAGDTLYPDRDDDTAALTELRAAYRLLQGVPEFAALRSNVPVLSVWDDHDFGRNDGGGNFPWRLESERLFERSWVEMDDPRRERPGIYFSELVGEAGKQLQLIVLDTRFFRSVLRSSDDRGAKGKERYIPDDDAQKTMLGDEQWRWLESQLQQDADLRIIVSSVQVLADGHGWEGWRQLPQERERLFDVLRANDTAPVLLLSGDRHVAGFYERDIGTNTSLVEFTSSALNNPISFPNRYKTLEEDGPYRLGDLYGEANFGSLDIDWKAGVVELSLHDASGQVVRTLLRTLSN